MTILSMNNYYINYYREGPVGDKEKREKKDLQEKIVLTLKTVSYV